MTPRSGPALILTLAALLGAAILSAAVAPGARLGPWGFDLTGRDTQVQPGADFYAYANGAAVRRLVIPPDRANLTSFAALETLADQRVRQILEAATANPDARGDEARIGAFWQAYMDEPRVEALGERPLQAELAAVRSATGRPALAALMGRSSAGYYGGVFNVRIDVDGEDPAHYAVYLSQAGLGLPDRDYYVLPGFAPQRAAYRTYIARLLTLARWPDAEAESQAIVDLETRIAEASWTRTELRDAAKRYNPMSPAELAAAAPGFDWTAFLAGAGLGDARRVIVEENTAVPKIAAIVAGTPVHTLQAWEAFTTADAAAPVLSQPFEDAQFDFRGRALLGETQPVPRWKRAADAISANLGDAVGRDYVARWFPPDARNQVRAIADQVRTAFAARMRRVAWMGEAARARALDKLSRLDVEVGYPDRWRGYDGLTITPDDLFGDVERAADFEWRRQLARLNAPVDRSEWSLPPQSVNAYYDLTRNEIVFPAAILQPPFFDPGADLAVNYGAIGAVIGHEMTHGYDDQGRRYDGEGRLTDGWAPEDEARFHAKAQRLEDQYSALEPIPGVHVKGDQTLGENLADLGGLGLALDAYHLALGGRAAPVLDGYSGDQRLFLGWAQLWRSASRPEALRRQLASDVHAPETARVDAVVRNIDAWYAVWGVTPADPLYLPPEQRVRIW